MMINRLLGDWHSRLKYVDGTTDFEVISRNSSIACWILLFQFPTTSLLLCLEKIELFSAELDFLSPRAWTYFYKILLRSCSLLLCKNFIGVDTFSSPIVSRSFSKTGVGFCLSRLFGASTGCSNSSP